MRSWNATGMRMMSPYSRATLRSVPSASRRIANVRPMAGNPVGPGGRRVLFAGMLFGAPELPFSREFRPGAPFHRKLHKPLTQRVCIRGDPFKSEVVARWFVSDAFSRTRSSKMPLTDPLTKHEVSFKLIAIFLRFAVLRYTRLTDIQVFSI